MINYSQLSDKELAQELADLEAEIIYWQNTAKSIRRQSNSAMEEREDIIQEIKRRGKNHGR